MGCGVGEAIAPGSLGSPSACTKHLVTVPLKKLPGRSVSDAFGKKYDFAVALVELLTIVELLPQPGAHVQAVARVDGEVAAVEHRVNVGAQQ